MKGGVNNNIKQDIMSSKKDKEKSGYYRFPTPLYEMDVIVVFGNDNIKELTERFKFQTDKAKRDLLDNDGYLGMTSYAFNENEWVGGSEVRLKTCGYVCGCSAYHTAKRYKTRREAFTAECSRVREYLKCHIKVTDGVIGVMVDSGATRLLRLLDEIEKPKPIQLELF